MVAKIVKLLTLQLEITIKAKHVRFAFIYSPYTIELLKRLKKLLIFIVPKNSSLILQKSNYLYRLHLYMQ